MLLLGFKTLGEVTEVQCGLVPGLSKCGQNRRWVCRAESSRGVPRGGFSVVRDGRGRAWQLWDLVLGNGLSTSALSLCSAAGICAVQLWVLTQWILLTECVCIGRNHRNPEIGIM